MPVRISGLRELRAELRAAADATPRELTAALREGAKTVTERSNQLAPEKNGALKADGRPFATATRAGVRYRLPYAGVQEYAVTWTRRNRSGKGTNEVRYTKLGPPPRFAHRAVEQEGPLLVEATFERLVAILRCHGWFRE
jgi:hypothetical protein